MLRVQRLSAAATTPACVLRMSSATIIGALVIIEGEQDAQPELVALRLAPLGVARFIDEMREHARSVPLLLCTGNEFERVVALGRGVKRELEPSLAARD